ncbi:hypothetical protein K8R03_05010 [Candidatus Kaiserbacteria bacterium]|nr:hypothetical protein [Candidatus Kaiserbacteria bacterium]
MPILLRERDDVSVNDLRTVAAVIPVVRTPHVGNSSVYNLVAAACKFPTVLVDTNTPGRDTTYHPHLYIRGGCATVLTECADPMQTLVTHLPVMNPSALPYGLVRATLVDVHIEQLKRVFPDTCIETHQSFMRRNRAYIEQALEIMTDAMPDAWYRKVSDAGALHVLSAAETNGVSSWRDIADNIFISPARSGWVVPNVFALILDMLVQMRDGCSAEVWMLSGPDMIRYMPKLQEKFDILYAALSRRLNLPATVTVHMVPFSDFKLAVRSVHREHLDTLLREVRLPVRNRQIIAQTAMQCPDLWCRTERQNHFTQHDMESAADIYVPPEFMEMPLRSCRALWEKIRSDVPKKNR